jgi:ribonuclease VapC
VAGTSRRSTSWTCRCPSRPRRAPSGSRPAAIRVELGIVIEARLWPAGQDVVDRFLRDAKIDIVAVDEELAARAISGWRRYGKGRHPAALNFGDCFTYALAERTGYPVLCTGDDFAATGISVSTAPSSCRPL